MTDTKTKLVPFSFASRRLSEFRASPTEPFIGRGGFIDVGAAIAEPKLREVLAVGN